MALQIITGSQSQLTATMSLLLQQGWLIFSSVVASGSSYSVLMGRGEGSTLQPLTQSISPESTWFGVTGSAASASGLWQNIFPRQTATDTLLGINTDPNVNWPYIRTNTGSFG
jgi:hypothetical protein